MLIFNDCARDGVLGAQHASTAWAVGFNEPAWLGSLQIQVSESVNTCLAWLESNYLRCIFHSLLSHVSCHSLNHCSGAWKLRKTTILPSQCSMSSVLQAGWALWQQSQLPQSQTFSLNPATCPQSSSEAQRYAHFACPDDHFLCIRQEPIAAVRNNFRLLHRTDFTLCAHSYRNHFSVPVHSVSAPVAKVKGLVFNSSKRRRDSTGKPAVTNQHSYVYFWHAHELDFVFSPEFDKIENRTISEQLSNSKYGRPELSIVTWPYNREWSAIVITTSWNFHWWNILQNEVVKLHSHFSAEQSMKNCLTTETGLTEDGVH